MHVLLDFCTMCDSSASILRYVQPASFTFWHVILAFGPHPHAMAQLCTVSHILASRSCLAPSSDCRHQHKLDLYVICHFVESQQAANVT